MKIDLPNKIFLTVITFSVIVIIFITGYRFLWLKDYNFIVEAECNPSSENCFYRDCSNEDDCPPNGLENYRVFEVLAPDFPKCSDNSCVSECVTGEVSCREIMCGDLEEDECGSSEVSIPNDNVDETLVDENVFEDEALNTEEEII